MARSALITGITGQDGSYLAELLLENEYEVHGLVRGSAEQRYERLEAVQDRLTLHGADLLDEGSLLEVLRKTAPDEIYNLAAMSSVSQSWRLAVATAEYTAVGVTRLLEAVREVCPEARFYQASSSEMFGAAPSPQSEATPFHPRSPYGVAKVAAFWATVNYREAYEIFAVNGILFNHESPRRGETFVTRKITRAVARIAAGLQDKLYLGNLDAKRDWGYAPDYVEAMWQMLQVDEPEDFVIATGETHSVREAVEIAFGRQGLDPEDHVEIDPRYYRPSEVDELHGDASKAREKLGWEPKVKFKELVELMVDADVAALQDQLAGKVTRYSHEGV